MKKPKILFISESIRRDSHAPLKFFEGFEVVHFYLKAPYGDMTEKDLVGARQVTLENLIREIIAEKPDIIQGPEPFGSRLSLKLAYISLRAARKSSARLVVPVLENRPINKRFSRVQRAALRVFCPAYFRYASRVVALNRGAVANVRAYFKDAKITTGIIWGVWGVDCELFKPSVKKKDGEIIYVGRLIEEKGLKYLFDGFKMACKKLPNISLKFVGGGPLEGELKNLVKENNLGKKIEFTGILKNAELPKVFSRAELTAYPSITDERWEEQVGTVNFQSLACGTPVLTTKSGAIPEYIKEGEGAILVPEKDSKALALAIERFFTDQKLKKRLTSLARQSGLKYDIRREIAKAEKMLLEVLKK